MVNYGKSIPQKCLGDSFVGTDVVKVFLSLHLQNMKNFLILEFFCLPNLQRYSSVLHALFPKTELLTGTFQGL